MYYIYRRMFAIFRERIPLYYRLPKDAFVFPLPKDCEHSPKHVGQVVLIDNWRYLLYFMCISWYT